MSLTKIEVVIDCNDELCGECKYRCMRMCSLFSIGKTNKEDFTLRSFNETQHKRCLACLESEVK